MSTTLKKGLNLLGVIAPAVCLVHCLATPVLLTVLPFLPNQHAGHAGHESSDTTLHWIVVAICALAILPAFRNHRRTRVLLLFVAGAACILLPAYVHIPTLIPHTAIAIVGSVFLVSANLLNQKYAKTASCCNHETHGWSDIGSAGLLLGLEKQPIDGSTGHQRPDELPHV